MNSKLLTDNLTSYLISKPDNELQTYEDQSFGSKVCIQKKRYQIRLAFRSPGNESKSFKMINLN